MARDFNQNRIANAILISKTIDFFGKRWAVQDHADGYSVVDVEVPAVPDDIKAFLEGDNDVTVFPIPSNINKLCEYALASFPNIETIYLFKNTSIVVLDDDLSYLTHLTKIYVPTDLLSAYQSAYPTLASKFDTILTDYTLTIEPLQGETVLTTQYLDEVIGMLSNAEKSAITKVLISNDFTTYYETVWAYDFSELSSLNDNIWHGSTLIKFDEYIIQGYGELTSAKVNAQYNNILSSRLVNIEKVIVPIEFTSYASGAITAIKNDFAYMETLTTTYSGGSLDIEIGGDIEQKIISLGKTLDEALVYARSITQIGDFNQDKSKLIILPPNNYIFNLVGVYNAWGYPNLVLGYFGNLDGFGYNNTFGFMDNALEINGTITGCQYRTAGTSQTCLRGTPILKRINLNFTNNADTDGNLWFFDATQSLEKCILQNCISSFRIGNNTNMTDQAFSDLFNSLGTPTNQRTITLTINDYNKLSPETIAIATNKNWQVVSA